MTEQVIIFDTTLRDGEQALNASLSVTEKLRIAQALEQLGADIIEAGFPVSSPGDFAAVRAIGQQLKKARVCALARAVKADIDACGEALRGRDFRIHTFISTSTIHVRHKLRRSFDEVRDMAIAAIAHARRYTDDVEFSCEDAGRTPIDQLCFMVEAAIRAGATTINIPDTVGYTTPTEFGNIIATLRNRVPNIDKAVLSVHCHNDLGLATANSLAALEQGARQVECTINGIGERAGNCALEEIVMILNTRRQHLGLHCQVNTTAISHTSRLVSQLCQMPVQPNKAIVGANAFSHSSGIHQDGVLKQQNTYEIMTPQSVGRQDNQLQLTARSGRHVIAHRMKALGYGPDDYDLDKLYQAFVALADKKGRVYDDELEALALFDNAREDARFVLDYVSVQAGSRQLPTASVRLLDNGRSHTAAATGNGPVNAVYNAISQLLPFDFELHQYRLQANGEGADAQGQVDVVIRYQGRTYHGSGLATDIIDASARALLVAANRIARQQQIQQHKQQQESA